MTTENFLGIAGALSVLCVTAAYAEQAKPASPAAQKPAIAAKASPESIESGAALYKRYCVMCHGATGMGDGPAAKTLKGKLPSLVDKAMMSKHTDAELHAVIAEGKKTEIGNMPPMGKKMTPEQITDVVNYVRTLAK